MAKPKQRFKTPLAACIYTRLNERDYKYKKEEGELRVCLIFNPNDPEHSKFLASLKANLPKGCNYTPYQPQVDKKTKVASGMYLVNFKTKFDIDVYDSSNKPAHNLSIGDGSKIMVSFEMSPYFDNGGKTGLSMYLKAVQVKEYVEYKGLTAEDYGFEEDAQGYVAPPPDEFGGEDFSAADKARATMSTPAADEFDQAPPPATFDQSPPPISEVPAPGDDILPPPPPPANDNAGGDDDLPF